MDAAGNVLIADTANSRVRVVAASTGTFYGRAMTAGDIYTIAVGSGVTKLDFPNGVAVDAAGNVLIADTGSHLVRALAASTGTFYGRAMTAGHIYTIAGNGDQADSGNGGPATSAELNFPQGVAVDAAGNVLIADEANGRVREVAG